MGMALAPREEPLVLDDRAWPLLVVRFPTVVSGETLRLVVRGINQVYERRERFVVVADTTPVMKFPSAEARQVLGDWLRDPTRSERERAYTLGTGVVVSSGPLRALTAAFNLVRRPVSPQHWTATFVEAVEWSKGRLAEAGIPLNPAIEALSAESSGVRRAPVPPTPPSRAQKRA